MTICVYVCAMHNLKERLLEEKPFILPTDSPVSAVTLKYTDKVSEPVSFN